MTKWTCTVSFRELNRDRSPFNAIELRGTTWQYMSGGESVRFLLPLALRQSSIATGCCNTKHGRSRSY